MDEINSLEDLSVHGMELLNSADIEEVKKGRKIFEGILTQHARDHPGVIFALATGYMREGRHGLAEQLFHRAFHLDDKFSEAYNNLGYICNVEGRFEEAKKYFDKSLELDPERVEFLSNMCTFYVNTGQPDTCIEWANKALAKAPDNNDARWNRSLAYLEKGMWPEGWADYKAGLHDSFTSSQRRKMREYGEAGKVPFWDGKPKKTVVVYGEQGVGDEILGMSMLEDIAKTCEVVLETHPRLVSIARHSFGEKFPIYGTRKVPWEKLSFPMWHNLDAQMPILGLGEFFRKTDADFPRKPYLKPYPEKVGKYKKWLDGLSDKPKVGITWKGGSAMTRFDLRSMPLPQMVEGLKDMDVEFISLQYDGADRPEWNTPIVAQFQENTGIDIHHDPEVVNDLDECYGGLIHALDLVISVNSSIVHACGAFGVPCWVLTPSRPAWRYNVAGAVPSVGDDKMIWYGDHVRQFRQVGDDWDGVLKQVVEAWHKTAAKVAA